ncbi:MAG: phosphonate metabolism protein/1,5-bisphosphokinase (PRPP-forming) PhnN [Promethearchaeia archaeon]
MKKQFPGTLFLVVGNSGSGKDSIISEALKKYPKNLKTLHGVKRYITRPASEYEKNISVTEKEFKKMKKAGDFALSWHIYHLYYGVPIQIDEWLQKGEPVVVNVSRTIIDDARTKYANLKVIFIKVPFEITLKRIKERGREDGEQLEERIERAKTHQTCDNADYVVDNSSKLEDAIDQFLDIIIKAQEGIQ